ncbi:MAG: hypothetical protein D6813_05085 [Calditrichaeota bacterium]|nr:MAG: hypothetical protein D6813_05085 [Calditrichota bacterium]
MKNKNGIKNSQRFVMYIPNELRKEIENWVNKKGITMAEFGREALEEYLNSKLREERHAQLAETCKKFNHFHKEVKERWKALENKDWPV